MILLCLVMDSVHNYGVFYRVILNTINSIFSIMLHEYLFKNCTATFAHDCTTETKLH